MAEHDRAWNTHPDMLEIRQYVGDIFRTREHVAAMTAARLAVGVHADRRPDDVLDAYRQEIGAAAGRLARALLREEIRR